MLKITKVQILPFALEHNEILWEIENTTEDVFDYEVFVLRSESEEGPFVTIAGPLIDRYYVRDVSVHKITGTRVHYYKLLIRNKITGETAEFGTYDIEGRPNLLVQEIARNETIMWREHAGTMFWLFPRRTFGQRCPNCFDKVMGSRMNASCQTCWGTGFSGGYHYPIEFWGQIDYGEVGDSHSLEDHSQPLNAVLRMPPSPGIKSMDLVIDYRNNRFRAGAMGGSTLNGVAVRQQVPLSLIQKSAIEYKIPLKTTKTDFVPQRNFTNPQDPTNIKLGALKKYGY